MELYIPTTYCTNVSVKVYGSRVNIIFLERLFSCTSYTVIFVDLHTHMCNNATARCVPINIYTTGCNITRGGEPMRRRGG